MARKVTVLKAEEEAIRLAVVALETEDCLTPKSRAATVTALEGLLAKLTAPKPEPRESGLPFYSIERALAIGKKYAPWWGSPARHVKALHEAGATLDQLEAVARWTDKQGWLEVYTLQSVANNWGSWLAKAMVVPVARPKLGGLVGFEDEGDE